MLSDDRIRLRVESVAVCVKKVQVRKSKYDRRIFRTGLHAIFCQYLKDGRTRQSSVAEQKNLFETERILCKP